MGRLHSGQTTGVAGAAVLAVPVAPVPTPRAHVLVQELAATL